MATKTQELRFAAIFMARTCLQTINLITFVVLAVLITYSNGWFYKMYTERKCSDPSRGRPFYFGTNNLHCTSKGKREASPYRYIHALSHRWIEYEGLYFEIVGENGAYHGSPFYSCSTKRESKPAGYSNLSVDCLKRCAKNYRQRYGGYKLLTNNCHHFANRFSDILCSRTTCPSWC